MLVATDIAARGLDIPLLPHVINFELPNVPEDYVHRIGRTGRAGASGEAISLIGEDELEYLRSIEKLLGEKLRMTQQSGYEATLEERPPKKQGGGGGRSRSNHSKPKGNGGSRPNKSRYRGNR